MNGCTMQGGCQTLPARALAQRRLRREAAPLAARRSAEPAGGRQQQDAVSSRRCSRLTRCARCAFRRGCRGRRHGLAIASAPRSRKRGREQRGEREARHRAGRSSSGAGAPPAPRGRRAAPARAVRRARGAPRDRHRRGGGRCPWKMCRRFRSCRRSSWSPDTSSLQARGKPRANRAKPGCAGTQGGSEGRPASVFWVEVQETASLIRDGSALSRAGAKSGIRFAPTPSRRC